MAKTATKRASRASPPKAKGGKAPGKSRRTNARAQRSAERRDAILAAALEEFAASGFAATRLDDVARRAGVAKGTIYLHFADKEALFQELIRSQLSPVVGVVVAASHSDIPMRVVAERLTEVFVRDVFGSRRKDVIRLVITEGPRFPKIAEFYYREVVSRAMGAMRDLLRRAVERGELKGDALVRFPQLIAAPMLIAIFWTGLFDRFEPLDARAMMRAYFKLIFGDGDSA